MGDMCSLHWLKSTECDQDRKLVRDKFKFKIRKKVRCNGLKTLKSIAVSRLSQPHIKILYQ